MELGDLALFSGDFQSAVSHFTVAIDAGRDGSRLYSTSPAAATELFLLHRRMLCYQGLSNWSKLAQVRGGGFGVGLEEIGGDLSGLLWVCF